MRVKKYLAVVLASTCLTSSVVETVFAKSKFSNEVTVTQVGRGGTRYLKKSNIKNVRLTTISSSHYWVRRCKNYDKCLNKVFKNIKLDNMYVDADEVCVEYYIECDNKDVSVTATFLKKKGS